MAEQYGRDSIILENVDCIQETQKAILVVVDEDYEEHWIPKSQLHNDSEVAGMGDSGNLIITRWIAEESGLWEGE